MKAQLAIKATKDHTSQHTLMVSKIRLTLGSLPNIALWPNPVKKVEVLTRSGVIHMMTGLIKGSADLVGLVTMPPVAIDGRLVVLGRFAGFEVKTGSGELEPDQLKWHRLVIARGGFATTVHNEAEAVAALDRCRRGLSS